MFFDKNITYSKYKKIISSGINFYCFHYDFNTLFWVFIAAKISFL